MGLDMYLSAHKYVGGWDHSKDEEKATFRAILAALGKDAEDATSDAPSLTVSVNVAYWRKANAIHRWFVEEVQDGEDECEEHYVEREQLESLMQLCREGLANETGDKLPPAAGFFFGGTEIDEGYFQDLTDTIAIVGKALDAFDDAWSFYYRSSW